MALTASWASVSMAEAARGVPLPRPKPAPPQATEQLRQIPRPRPRPSPSVAATEAVETPETGDADASETELVHRDRCLNGLIARGVSANRAGDFVASGPCIIRDPVRIERIAAQDGRVSFPAKPLLNCEFAAALSAWVRGVVSPVAMGLMSSPLKTMHTGPGYECRMRNRSAEGKLSAHAIGDALDIAGFELSDGRRVMVEAFGSAPDREQEFLASIRTSGCGYFTTVLGPGSDEAHKGHLHVDIIPHGRTVNYRICE